MFNLATDADDPVLGFTTLWLNRLAANFDQVDVITMRAGRLALAPNVRVWSVGKERGFSEFRRAVVFYRVLAERLFSRRYTACFAHMMPLFAVMGAPLLRLFGVPITLWYTHRQTHRTLRWAEKVSRRVVTAAPDSFPLPTEKLRVIGHGIDTDFFAPANDPKAKIPTIVHVARLMPIKHQATLIKALAQIEDVRAEFLGGVPPDQQASYRSELEALALECQVSDRVVFLGDQSRDQVAAAYRKGIAAVNLSPVGLFDKAALESMATGVPTIVSNPAFALLLEPFTALLLIDSPEDVVGLTDRLRRLVAMPLKQQVQIGQHLRNRVISAHSLNGLTRRLVDVLLTGEIEVEDTSA